MRHHRVIFGIGPSVFLFISVCIAQVNTEAMRLEDLTPGLHSQLAFNLGYMAGNSKLLNLKSGLRFDVLKNGYHLFAVTQYQQGRKDQERFVNKAFVHLRGVKSLTSRLQLEGYLQREFNEFVDLEDRRLLGGGARIRWIRPMDSPNLRLVSGLGLMWERERIDTSGQSPGDPVHGHLADLVRSTNYLVVRWKRDERLSLFSTIYYQVDPRRFSDYRILWEGNLSFAVTRRLAFTLNLNLRYDNEPPVDVQEKYDLEVLNGISYRF